MLDWGIVRWVEELDVAEAFRDRHLSHWDTIIERMTGPDYRDEGSSEGGDPENFVHQYMALILPRLVYDNPRVRVSSRTPMEHMIFGKQIQAAINSWAETKLDFGSCTTGVANAFTLGAQDFAAPEARYQMQNAGSLALSILQ